ncbi:ATP11 protein [Popillia japonica]|uniref:ATP11 protein n=1 Tax=Popillia japonica TaxID=7064 RepID=A0AAW1IYW8_POPJA
MTSAARCDKVVEELEKNPYFEKYADKIAKLQQTSPQELVSRFEEQKTKSKSTPSKDRQYTSLLQPKKKLETLSDPSDEPLDKIMKTDLIRDKEPDEIKKIWEQYHIQKDIIAATIPSAEFDIIIEQSKKFPIFIFALPRSQGYEFIMSEFKQNTVHFTPLICYQVHKENAPECLTIKHYVEFKDKGIVLMRGEFDKNVIDVKEAQCLANQLQLYYNNRDIEKTKLLNLFSLHPDQFKHMDLIKQIENISL